MGERTGIEWTDATWNPWQGCHKVSPGCKNCYMFREKRAYGQEPNVVVRSKPQTFNLPRRLRTPQRVFTCSWSDFFIEEADPWRDEAWAIIRATPHLTYQILTKRIERVQPLLPWSYGTPWPHVWIIVSVEDQLRADQRVPELLRVNAAIRGVSYEPALVSVDFSRWLYHGDTCGFALYGDPAICTCAAPPLDWLIVGGESGPSARPMHTSWARAVRDQCQAAGVPFFFKQWGEWAPFMVNGPVPMYDGRQYRRVTPDGRSFPWTDEWRPGDECVGRVGKKAAGALLDGREWREFPR